MFLTRTSTSPAERKTTPRGPAAQRAPSILHLAAYLLVALGSGCTGAAGDAELETVAKVQQAAASDVAAVLQGKIVSPPANSAGVALSTRGEPGVNEAGATTYEVPIWAPDGVNGMQPKLSVVYESNGSFGLLGRKWSVSGLSVIRRCPKTLAQDRASAPVNFEGDEFCLDGARLVRVSGSANGSGEFRTERNPFEKIVAVGSTSKGVQSFQIYQPDGRVLYYGRGSGSRLRATPSKFPSGLMTEVAAAFYLDKVMDRFGNSMLIQYWTQGPLMNQPIQLVPYRIRWGATGETAGQRQMQFSYGSSLGGDAAHTRWMSGLSIRGGQRLERIDITAPDGAGNVPLLKVYKFSYLTPTITKENLLSTITECDGASVCKRPTTITWEPGSWQHARTDLTTLGVDDVSFATSSAEDRNLYRRFLAADVNQDGRDDLVYRGLVPSQGNGVCFGWKVRQALPNGTFGNPSALPLGGDPDPWCTDGTTNYSAYPGDIVLADINRDGYPDIVSPVGSLQSTGNPQFPRSPHQSSYGAYLNKALPAGTAQFGIRRAFEDAKLNYQNDWCEFSGGSVNGSSPQIGLGDVDGDAYPEIIRPNYYWPFCIDDNFPPMGGLTFTTIHNSGGDATPLFSEENIPGLEPRNPKSGPGPRVFGFSPLDADGDGVAEVLADLSDNLGNLSTWLYSKTMTGQVPTRLPTANAPQMLPPDSAVQSSRWVLDLNGDGLKDVASVFASDPSTIVTNISTGKGFSVVNTTTLSEGSAIGLSWRDALDNGARVVDYNLDGRQDLVLVDDGFATAGPTRLYQVVLLSDGAGKFTVLNTAQLGVAPIPVGDSADGFVNASGRVAPGKKGYRTSIALDFNGDSLPDFLQLESGRLVLYTRQGNLPDFVIGIDEGTGRRIAATYTPTTNSNVYTPNPSACADAPDRLSCSIMGQWLTSSLSIESCANRDRWRQTFTYQGGIMDRGGLGFQGFQRRDIHGPFSTHVTKHFRAGSSANLVGPGGNWSPRYAYPEAFKPWLVHTHVETPQGPNSHFVTNEYRSYKFTILNPADPLARYSVLPETAITYRYDCPPTTGSDGITVCAPPVRGLGSTARTFEHDGFGNLTSEITEYFNESNLLQQRDTQTTDYYADSTATGLVSVPQSKTATSVTVSPDEIVTRTTTYQADWSTHAVSGLPKGAVSRIDTEPSSSGATPTWLRTQLSLDSRGRVAWRLQIAPGATTRTEGYLYEDADGVYVTTTTDATGFKTRTWRHAGYGFVVQTNDANGAATTYKYDTFGRLLAQAAPTGESSSTSYTDPTTAKLCGTESTLYPTDSTTRAIEIHADPFGAEASRRWSIDAGRNLTKRTTYDVVGRVTGTRTSTEDGTQLTYTSTRYDDRGRVLSDCRPATSDGSEVCTTNVYDGFATTSTDAAGRVTTAKTDAMGRLSISQAAGVPDTHFTYGPFGLLRQERTADGTGQTDIEYDVLGRRITLTRSGAGTRRTSYNPYGEVTETAKQKPDGTLVESVMFGHDALGRVTTTTGSGLNRTLSWDAPAASPTTPAPNAKGKLVEMRDGSTLVRFEYYPSGLLKKKTWSTAIAGSSADFGAEFEYDTQGRPSRTIYPKVPAWSNALAVSYAYDPYIGDVSSLTIPGVSPAPPFPVWRVTARDQLGIPSTEVMRGATGLDTTLTRVTYPQTGAVQSVDFASSNGAASLRYAYDGTGIPISFGMSGIGGTWQSKFGYDSLRRLTSFVPAQCCGGIDVTLRYSYDADGNLIRRDWGSPGGGENVVYDKTVAADGSYARTLSRSGLGQPWTDYYQADPWGRILDTPAIALAYNALDELTSVTEKSNGQSDAVYRDGSGGRVVTTYGNPSSGQPWSALYTLDELSEIRSSNSGLEERSRLRVGGRLVGELVRTSSVASRTATFYLADNVGSVVAESTTGLVSARVRRDPFGNRLDNPTWLDLPRDPAGTDQDGSGRMAFADHARENNWGVVDMVARLYSPRLGRFLSPDPILARPFDRRSHNAFSYVRNLPTAAADPLGMADNYTSSSADYTDDPGYTPADSSTSSTDLSSNVSVPSATDAGGLCADFALIMSVLPDDLASYDDPRARRKATQASRGATETNLEDVISPVGDALDVANVALDAVEGTYQQGMKLYFETLRDTTKAMPEYVPSWKPQLAGAIGKTVGGLAVWADASETSIHLYKGHHAQAVSSGIDLAAGTTGLLVSSLAPPIGLAVLTKKLYMAYPYDENPMAAFRERAVQFGHWSAVALPQAGEWQPTGRTKSMNQMLQEIDKKGR